jgi:iron complex outermembrane recepter protein
LLVVIWRGFMSHIARVAALAAAFASMPLLAQQAPAEKEVKEVKKGEKIEVTASPLGRAETELAQPATVLREEDLRRKRAASIGDTLSQEVGVQSSAFGPGAGRPIIRGLDGPRIRVLENGLGTLDASTVSPDHMVVTESLHAEQIEILRGPASLLYGSGAIGGVVNVVSNLIPRAAPEKFTGSIEARAASANRERTGSANLNGAAGTWAWHLDGFRRSTDDYRIPGGRLADSAVDARGGGIGGSFIASRGYLGAGVSRTESVYGVPSGEGTRIDLRQNRFESAGELADALPGVEQMRFRIGHSDYRHREIESSGEIATIFTNRASEGRVEVRHRAVAGIKGTIGAQVHQQDLAAIGEEAVIPPTRAKAAGLFVVEQLESGALTFDAGARIERERREPSTAPARSFSLVTPAAGIVWKATPDLRLSVSATQAQRAPSIEELYSNGPHAATATFDVGDPNLRKEVSRNVDVTLRKVGGNVQWKLNVFANRFKDYVHATPVDANGDGVADLENGFLLQQFTQGPARFRGVEAELTARPGGGGWGMRVFGDVIRATLEDGSNVPRIAPARIGASIDASRGPWSIQASATRAFAQKRVAPLETPTPGYTRVDAELAWKLEGAPGQASTFFLQGTNLLDQAMRLHTSYLKDVAPLMGRSFTLGLRGEF